MSIIRIAARCRYTSIANPALEDRRLSFKARGLLAYLLTKPDHWETNVFALAKESQQDKETAIRSALKELQDHGYAAYQRPRDEKGIFQKGGWEIRENPHVENPHVENPHVDDPHVENHKQVNTDLVKTELAKTEPPKNMGESAKTPAYSPAFVQFWQAYPVKKHKDKAWEAWKRRKLGPLVDTITASITMHQASDPDWKKGYIPNPATYLNGGGWKDELTTERGALNGKSQDFLTWPEDEQLAYLERNRLEH